MSFSSLEIDRLTDYLIQRRANLAWPCQQVCSGETSVMTAEEKNDVWTYLLQSLPSLAGPEDASRTEPNIPVFKSSVTSSDLSPFIGELHAFSLNLLREIHASPPLHSCDSLLQQLNHSVLRGIQKIIESNIKAWEDRQRALFTEQQTQNLHLNVFIHDQTSSLRRLIHDARGSLGLVSGAAALLSVEQTSPEHRNKFRDVLDRNLTSVEEKLTEILQNFRFNPSGTTNKQR